MSLSETELKTIRQGEQKLLRTMTIIDESNQEVQFKLWGSVCSMPGLETGTIIMVKNAYITEFKSLKQLSYIPATVVEVNPKTAEGLALQEWYERKFHKIIA